MYNKRNSNVRNNKIRTNTIPKIKDPFSSLLPDDVRAYGGTPMYISSPEEDIEMGNIARAKAELDALESTQYLEDIGNVLSTTGSIMQSYGGSGKGLSGLTRTKSVNVQSPNPALRNTMPEFGKTGFDPYRKPIGKFDTGGEPTPLYNYKGVKGNFKVRSFIDKDGNYKNYLYSDSNVPYSLDNYNDNIRVLQQNNPNVEFINGDYDTNGIRLKNAPSSRTEYLRNDMAWKLEGDGLPEEGHLITYKTSNMNTGNTSKERLRSLESSGVNNFEDYGLSNSDKSIYDNQDFRTEKFNNFVKNIDKNKLISKRAYGGEIPIEAEGEEIIQEPNGNIYELEGNSHEQGGIDLDIPQGSQIYSKRLKGLDGKTMADRKAFREKHLAKLEKLVSLNPNDKILKKTLEKTKIDFEKQDAEDMSYMNYMHNEKSLEEDIAKEIFDTGGTKLKQPRIRKQEEVLNIVPLSFSEYNSPLENVSLDNKYYRNPSLSTPPIQENKGIIENDTNYNKSNPFDFVDKINSPVTLGDAISLYGQYKSATDPEKMTLLNRSNDVPNQNFFRNYGKEGLKKLEESERFADYELAEAIKNNNLNATAQKISNNNNARSINTLNTLNLATEAQRMQADDVAYNNYLREIARLKQAEANQLNQIDERVMYGEAQRDDADRRDRDNFNRQLQIDTNTKNRGIQEIGKSINDISERQSNLQAINNMYPDFNISKNGKITAKGNPEDWTPEQKYWNGKSSRDYQKFLEKKKEGYFFDNDTQAIYNKDGQEVDKSYNVIPNGKSIDVSDKKKKDYDADTKKINTFTKILGDDFGKLPRDKQLEVIDEVFVKGNKYYEAGKFSNLFEKYSKNTDFKNFTDPTTGYQFANKQDYDKFTETNPNYELKPFVESEFLTRYNPIKKNLKGQIEYSYDTNSKDSNGKNIVTTNKGSISPELLNERLLGVSKNFKNKYDKPLDLKEVLNPGYDDVTKFFEENYNFNVNEEDLKTKKGKEKILNDLIHFIAR